MSSRDLHEWRRGPRADFRLGPEHGVYALFLKRGSHLPGIEPGRGGLLYIGLAASRTGLKGRCHFNARTVNHSPRKSLAVLLMRDVGLVPALVPKPNSPSTWGLDAASDSKLTNWMHANLDLAIELCDNPAARECELISLHSPPLNLTNCDQTPARQSLFAARSAVMRQLTSCR